MKYFQTFALSKSRVQSRKVSLTNFFRLKALNKKIFRLKKLRIEFNEI